MIPTGVREVITGGVNRETLAWKFTETNTATYTRVFGSVRDFDGDSIPDFASTNGSTLFSIVLGSRSGGFQDVLPPVSLPEGTSVQGDLHPADLDGDGDLDVILACTPSPGRGTDLILMNDGSGRFSLGQELGDGDTRALAIVDVDQNDALDIVQWTLNSQAQIWLNEGAGEFGRGATFGENSGAYALLPCDVDQDGISDLFCGNGYESRSMLWRGRGDGTFEELRSFPPWDTGSAAIGNLFGDSRLEVIETAPTGIRSVITSLEDPTQRVYLPYTANRGVRVADLGGSPTDDIVMFGLSGPSVLFLIGDGEGAFRPQRTPLDDEIETIDVEFADLDGDGDLDVVALHASYGYRVFENLQR